MYGTRITKVEGGSFTPLAFLNNGAAGKETLQALKQLAAHVAKKKHTQYSIAMRQIREKIGFSLLQSSIILLRGARFRSLSADVDADSVE